MEQAPPTKRPRYDAAFRAEALRLASESRSTLDAARALNIDANRVWVSDITCLPLASGSWAYLCAFQAIISTSEADRYNTSAHRHLTTTHLTYKLVIGTERIYSTITATYNTRLFASDFDQLPTAEQQALFPLVLSFIKAIGSYKKGWAETGTTN